MKALISLIVLNICCWTNSFGQNEVPSSPFTNFNGYMYVETSFPNCDKPVLFLFDTGTDNLSVNRDFTDALRLTGGETLEFKMGNIKLSATYHFPTENNRPDSLARLYLGDLLKGKLFGGIIGNTVYNDKYVVIDYPNEMIYMSDSKPSNAKEVNYVPFSYNLNQVFVKGKLNNKLTAYFHLDTGIPSSNVIEFESAQKAELSDLTDTPNNSNELVQEFTYDEDGNPTSMTEKVMSKSNHNQLSYCSSFKILNFDFGKQNFETMNTDLDKEVFPNAGIAPIVGSIAYETMKNYQIHIDFPERKIALILEE